MKASPKIVLHLHEVTAEARAQHSLSKWVRATHHFDHCKLGFSSKDAMEKFVTILRDVVAAGAWKVPETVATSKKWVVSLSVRYHNCNMMRTNLQLHLFCGNTILFVFADGLLLYTTWGIVRYGVGAVVARAKAEVQESEVSIRAAFKGDLEELKSRAKQMVALSEAFTAKLKRGEVNDEEAAEFQAYVEHKI